MNKDVRTCKDCIHAYKDKEFGLWCCKKEVGLIPYYKMGNPTGCKHFIDKVERLIKL